jgi:DNA-binding protein
MAAADETQQAPAVDEDNKQTDAENKDDAQAEEEQIYQPSLPNRVIVARNHPLNYYVDRARRILRIEEELYVSGRGNTTSMACTLVEVLKRQQIAEIKTVATGMNVEPFFSASGEPRWSPPTSMITFVLKRGKFAEYVADYHQRKVIEIFEKTAKTNQTLSADEIASLDMAAKFKANDEQCENAKKFMDGRKELNLPDFIRYASLLIHPLLKDKVFKDVLREEYQIDVNVERTAQSSP